MGLYTRNSKDIQRDAVSDFCRKVARQGVEKLLIVPPDYSRFYSGAGGILNQLCSELFVQKNDIVIDILPATGYHKPMTIVQQKTMFGNDVVERCSFLTHDPLSMKNFYFADFSVAELKDFFPDFPDFFFKKITYAVSSFLDPSRYDMVLSLGQVLPHEVVGMSNYTKNIVIGLGSKELIDFSHLASALIGVNNIIGRAKNVVRNFLDASFEKLQKSYWREDFIHFMLIVSSFENGVACLHSLRCGCNREIFDLACKDAFDVNVFSMDKIFSLVVVDLPNFYTSTWIANKSIYRLRKIVAKGGILLILAPSLRSFGESKLFDDQIRKIGYHSARDRIVSLLSEGSDLSPAVAAHLMHGHVGGDFRVVYAIDENNLNNGLSKEDFIEVGYEYMCLEKAKNMMFDVEKKKIEGMVVKDPGQGLWVTKEDWRFLLSD